MLELNNIIKTFDDGTAALNGVDLSIQEGEFIVLLGPSGSGKTTLIRSISGLVKPNDGIIKFKGKLITEENYLHIQKHILCYSIIYFNKKNKKQTIIL